MLSLWTVDTSAVLLRGSEYGSVRGSKNGSNNKRESSQSELVVGAMPRLSPKHVLGHCAAVCTIERAVGVAATAESAPASIQPTFYCALLYHACEFKHRCEWTPGLGGLQLSPLHSGTREHGNALGTAHPSNNLSKG